MVEPGHLEPVNVAGLTEAEKLAIYFVTLCRPGEAAPTDREVLDQLNDTQYGADVLAAELVIAVLLTGRIAERLHGSGATDETWSLHEPDIPNLTDLMGGERRASAIAGDVSALFTAARDRPGTVAELGERVLLRWGGRGILRVAVLTAALLPKSGPNRQSDIDWLADRLREQSGRYLG